MQYLLDFGAMKRLSVWLKPKFVNGFRWSALNNGLVIESQISPSSVFFLWGNFTGLIKFIL